MEIQQKEPVANFFELIKKMKYFSKLKPDSKNNNSFSTEIEVLSYFELNQKISSLIKTSINMLKDNASENRIDAMLLLEIALQLLPNDEMEILDELRGISLGVKVIN